MPANEKSVKPELKEADGLFFELFAIVASGLTNQSMESGL